ncbi:hypothetical protein Ntsu_40120 [Nocardia sp. IFM 10818]
MLCLELPALEQTGPTPRPSRATTEPSLPDMRTDNAMLRDMRCPGKGIADRIACAAVEFDGTNRAVRR